MIRLHLSHRCNIGLLLTYYLINKLKEKTNVFIPLDAGKFNTIHIRKILGKPITVIVTAWLP